MRAWCRLADGGLLKSKRRPHSVSSRAERCVRRSIFALLVLTTTTHAQSVIFTYDRWEQLSIGLQEIYLAGAIDWLSTVATPPSAGTGKFYNDCLVKKQITAHTIAEEMKAIVQTRPELRPVRFGSKTDICSATGHVRFAPESGHVQCKCPCPLWANSGHEVANLCPRNDGARGGFGSSLDDMHQPYRQRGITDNYMPTR